MCLIKFFNRRIKLFTIWDIKLSQLSAMILMLIIVKLVPVILQVPYLWLIIGLVLIVLRPLYVMFIKKGNI
ncbi:MAG: hypothetical protein JXB60_06785 [Candidatus Cloacimonetes bacterium]|nr:hypothetical protein [Candidatus Cloacimonadota bacterium]